MYILETNPILIISAVIPAIILLVKIYKADKLEREPISLVLSLVFLGILSTAGAMVLEEAGDYVAQLLFNKDSLAYNIFFYYLVVGVAEEGCKYLLLRLRTWKSKDFNCRFDGIVYAVCVSLGFALWENIGYVAMYGFRTALTRAVTAVPGHCCFGIFMGLWYGVAKYFDNIGRPEISKKFRRRSLLLPIIIHGTYDFLTTLDLLWFLFIPFVIGMFIIAFRTVKKTSAHDVVISNNTENINGNNNINSVNYGNNGNYGNNVNYGNNANYGSTPGYGNYNNNYGNNGGYGNNGNYGSSSGYGNYGNNNNNGNPYQR